MGDGKLRRAAGWGVLLLSLLLSACTGFRAYPNNSGKLGI